MSALGILRHFSDSGLLDRLINKEYQGGAGKVSFRLCSARKRFILIESKFFIYYKL